MQPLHKRRLFLRFAFLIDLVDLVGLKVERILGEPHGFLELYGAAMKATHLRDAQFLAGFYVVLYDAFFGAELDDFTLHPPQLQFIMDGSALLTYGWVMKLGL